MRSFRHYLPGSWQRPRRTKHSSTPFRAFFTRSTSRLMIRAHAAVHARVPSELAASSVTPDIAKIWVTTVKARQTGLAITSANPRAPRRRRQASQSRPLRLLATADSPTTLHPSFLQHLLMRMEFAMSSIHSPLLSHSAFRIPSARPR